MSADSGDGRVQLASVTLKGWKVIAFLVVAALYTVARYYNRQQSLESAGREAVRSWVALESQRASLASHGLDAAPDSAELAELLRSRDIEINEMTGRGVGDNMVVRVVISMHGGPPPDGRSIRYFRLVHSLLTGWRVLGESTALRYYTRFW